MRKLLFDNHNFINTITLTTFCLLINFSLINQQSVFSQETSGNAEAVTAQQQQDLDFADGLYQREMYETATKRYADFLEKYPNSPMREIAMFRQAESLYQQSLELDEADTVQGKIAMIDANRIFDDLIAEFPNGEKINEARLRFGEISYKLGDTESAIPQLEKVIEQAQDQSLIEAALFYAARSHDREEHYESAEKYYRRLQSEYQQGEYTAFSVYLLAGILEKTERAMQAAELLKDLWQNKSQYTFPENSTLIEDAQLQAAQILYRNKNYDEASKAYRAYVEMHPSGEHAPKAKYGAAWAEYQNQNFAEALNIANSLEQQALPSELLAGILFLKGTCSYQQNLYQDAITNFRQVIADPNAGEYRTRAWYQLAWSYFLSQKYEDTVAECQNLLKQNLSLEIGSNVHFLLGQAYAKLDQFDLAIVEMNMVLDLAADSEFAPDALFLKADILYRAKDYDQAGAEFKQYYLNYSNSNRAEEALLWACNAYFSSKNHQKAIDTAQLFVETFSNANEKNEILYRKALAHYQLDQLEKTLETFDQLLASSDVSRKPNALYWQGYINEQRDNYNVAVDLYDQLLTDYLAFDEELDVTLRKAICSYKLDQHDAAYEAFMRVIKTPKGNEIYPEILFWLISYAEEHENYQEALYISNRILELFDREEIRERALIAKSKQLVALEQWDETITVAKTFLEKYPDSLFFPEIHWAYGKALEKTGEKEQAIEHYETSLVNLTKMGNPDPDLEAKIYLDWGDMFLDTKNYQSALESYLRVAIIYDHPELTPKALYKSIECYINLDNPEEAKTLYAELQNDYAQSSWSLKAKDDFAKHMN